MSTWPIRGKLLLIVLAVLLPACGVLVASNLALRRQKIQSAEQNIQLFVHSLASQQERMAHGTKMMLSTLAGLPHVQALDVQACRDLFSDLLKQHPYYTTIGLATPDGNLIADARPLSSEVVNISEQKHIRDAIRALDFSVGEYIVGKVTRLPTIHYGYPVLDADRHLKAIVVAGFNLDDYVSFIAHANLPEGSALSIVDHGGARLFRFPQNNAVPIGKAVPADVLKRASGHHEEGGFERFSDDGTHRYYAFKRLRLREDSPPYLYIFAGTAKEPILREADVDLALNLSVLFFFTLVAAGFAWALARSTIVRPMKQLALAAHRIGLGDMGTRTGLAHTTDELGQLARSFDEMLSLLQFKDLERTRAEDELKESERKYRQLFEVESDALFVVEVDTLNILDVNPSVEKLYGYSRRELLTMRVLDISVEGEETSRGIHDEVDHVSVRRHKKKDGTVFPVEIAATYFLMGGKRIHLAAVRDISVRMQAEQALRESEERWQFALEGAGDGVWDWNAETGEVVYSRQWKAMLGYDEQEIGGTLDEWDRRIHPEERSQVYEELEKHFSGRTEFYVSEHRLRCKDGTYKWVLDRGKVVQRAEDGRPLRVIGTHADIEERKRSEQERLRLEQQLQQAQKAESLARMAGAIAHNFNNMLGAVIGNLELASEGLSQGSELHTFIGEAMKASQRAAGISRFMLTYLGQTSGKATPVDPAAAISEAFSLMGPSLPPNVHLNAGIHDHRFIIRADGPHLTQILIGLITNGVEAIGEQEGQITIAMEVVPGTRIQGANLFPLGWEPTAAEYVCMGIADTGCGIAPEDLDKIFDPFFSTKFTGRGLGLSVVSGLLRSMEGAISVESDSGNGATFRLFLPVAEPEVPAPPRGETSVGSLTRPGGLVLVVDDEAMVRSMAEAMLKRRFGYEVAAASDGHEALKIFSAGKDEINLVLLDLGMPGMNGWQTLSALRALRSDIPVILMSGYDEAQVMDYGSAERPRAFLHKPFGVKDLQAAIAAARDSSPTG